MTTRSDERRNFSAQVAAGATRERTLTAKDLDTVHRRWQRIASNAYDAAKQVTSSAAVFGDDDMAIFSALNSIGDTLDEQATKIYAAYERYGRHAQDLNVSDVRLARILSDVARVYTYYHVAYPAATRALTVITHEFALFQSYVGVAIPEIGVAEDEDLFA